DYSKASGADALIVTTSEVRDVAAGAGVQLKAVTLGGRKVTVLTLSEKGDTPEITVNADKLVIGGQTVTMSEKALGLGTFTPLK
ncbi:MAG: hypothetical protein WCL32_25135, partial [Planctomycetota bacterium]